jgi:hypothetical protein
MKMPVIPTAGSVILALAISSPAVFAEQLPHLKKYDKLPPSAFITQEVDPEIQAAFDARPWESNCGKVPCASKSLNMQWEKPRPNNGAHDIYDRAYQRGYRNYLDADLSNNPIPTPISEGTWKHRYQWVDGHRVPREDT